ncbi:MAG TPA: NAD(P)/FAD-dependent oxidoreductase [Capsulimonadaceae bacterium]
MDLKDINADDLYDVTIIGGGPAGLFAAYYAGVRQLKTKVLDSLPELGGQLTALYPEKYIYDVAGFPKILAKDLVANLVEQMMQQNPTVELDIHITDLKRYDDFLVLTTDTGVSHYTKAVIITAGVGAFSPRKPKLDRLDYFEKCGVHYAVRQKAKLAGKNLLIAGGGDSAFDWVQNLHDVAKSITLIHRSDKFRAHEESVLKVVEGGLCTIKTFHELKELHGDDHLNGVTIFDNRTNEEEKLEVDELLVTMGFQSSLGPIKNWGLEVQGNSIVVNTRMETSVPRVYGAGDIITYPGKLKLIITGFGDAAVAINHVKALVDPSAKLFPGHSSNG